MAKLILGLAGEMGSGKGTVASYIVEKYNGNSHSFSTALKEILDRLYLEKSRNNISKLSKMMRDSFGEDVFAKAMHLEVEKDECEVAIVENIRRIDDIKHLQDLPHFKFVYIESDLEKRYERQVIRNQYVGDNAKTFEEFKKEHELNTEATIPPLKKYADYVIDNNGALEDLHLQIDKLIGDEMGREK